MNSRLNRFFLPAFLLAIAPSFGATPDLFNDGWKFARFGYMPDGSVLQEPADLKAFSFNDASWRSINLPHDWGIEGPFRMDLPNKTGKLPWMGIGWYRKTFDVNANDKNKKFYLDFDGVMSCPEIYVNGQLAGEWKYGYSSFRVDITPFIQPGKENVVAVRVDNPAFSSRWYPGGGIYRNVWMTVSNPVHVDHWGVFVRTPQIDASKAVVEIDTTVVNTSDDQVFLSVLEEILNDGKVVASAETKDVDIEAGKTATFPSKIEVANPVLWDLENPHLYTLRTTVKVDGKPVDSVITFDTVTTDFGIRSAEWKSDGFYLNGKRIPLNGVCQHHDLGPLGGAVHYKGYLRQVQILKEMGVNSIRTTHNPAAPELLEICDREGILIIGELFDTWEHQKNSDDYHKYFKEWHERDLVNFCRRDRNHPSVIAWSSGNEIHEQSSKGGLETSRMLTALFHREDPTRPVTAGCSYANAAQNGFADTIDVYGFNYKPNLYADFVKRYPDKPVYGSETASTISSRGMYDPDANPFWDKGKGRMHYQMSSYDLSAPGWSFRPDIEFAGLDDNPTTAGEYVWTGFDYIGEPTPFQNDPTNELNFSDPVEREKAMKEMAELGKLSPSRSSYFGIVDLCGFKKDRFYLYQSRWKSDLPMAHILPHWNWPDRVGKVTPVHVYTSGDEAELFLNGKSLGKKHKGKEDNNRYRLVWEDVVYEPGELKVVATKDGKEWATASVKTTDKPAAVKLTPEHPAIKGDGMDLSYVIVTVRDKNGDIVPTADNEFTFTASGPAEIIGICNGDATDFTTMRITEPGPVKIKAFSGMAQVVLRSKKGAEGQAVLNASSPGLDTAKTTITVSKATPEEIKNAR